MKHNTVLTAQFFKKLILNQLSRKVEMKKPPETGRPDIINNTI